MAATEGNLEEARGMYGQAYTYDPACTAAMYNVGLLSKHMGDMDSALDAFEKSMLAAPDAVDIMLQACSLGFRLASTCYANDLSLVWGNGLCEKCFHMHAACLQLQQGLRDVLQEHRLHGA